MRKTLRKVAHQAAAHDVVLFRQQPQVVAQGQQTVEKPLRIAQPALHDVGVRQPETARQEDALLALQPVVGILDRIPAQQAAVHEFAFDRVYGARHARIACRQKAHLRDQQQARVQRRRSVTLHEAAASAVVAMLADVLVDAFAQPAPGIDRPLQAPALAGLDRPVERHPAHHARMREGAPFAPDFPDAVVQFAPALLQRLEQHVLQAPGFGQRRQIRDAGGVERINEFAVDVELALPRRAIAPAHRLAAFVAGQPRNLQLGQPAIARDAVHDLQLIGVSRHRAQQPLAPRLGLFAIAGVEQGVQRQRRVAQPAMAVVPIAAAAQRFRQRRGGRRDDPARRLKSQQFQRDQRTHHGIATPVARPVPMTAFGPFLPPRHGAVHAFDAVRHEPGRTVRAVIGQRERHDAARMQRETRRGLHVVAFELDGRMQLDRVRARDGVQAIIAPPHPRHALTVVEAQDQLHVHLHMAGLAAHDAHHVHALVVVAERHEVVHQHRARTGLEAGLQHRRVGHVAAGRRLDLAVRRDQPAPVTLVAQQGGKARGRIEMRQAQPVDRAVARHQRGGQHVADESVVFQGFGHARLSPRRGIRGIASCRRPRRAWCR